MPQQLPAQPGQGPAPTGPTGPTSPPSMEGLLGGGQGGVTPSPVTPEQQAEALMGQFRDLSTSIQALARQFPAAAQDLSVCNDSLINAMTKVLSGMSAESSSAPPVLM